MPKHDPPGDDATLLELERELMELDRAIRAADEKRESIDYALFDRRDELMARIFNTPAAGLAGLAVQARAYLSASSAGPSPRGAPARRIGQYPKAQREAPTRPAKRRHIAGRVLRHLPDRLRAEHAHAVEFALVQHH